MNKISWQQRKRGWNSREKEPGDGYWKVIHGPYLFRAGNTLNKGLGQLKIKLESV